MKILSLGKTINHPTLEITSIEISELSAQHDLSDYAYIILSGGDGSVRRAVNRLQHFQHTATFILNPTGSFNFVAKLHKVRKIDKILDAIAKGEQIPSEKHHYFSLNDEIFLFSAGNMGDLQHILVAETLRFGLLKHHMGKYVLALLFLLPMHLFITPFMLLSRNRFFIFTPLRIIKKFGSFYGEVKEMTIHLENHYNHLELDGDIVTIETDTLHIKPAGFIRLAK